jgi:hypothetical protein
MVLAIAAIPLSLVIRNPEPGQNRMAAMARTDRPVSWLNLLNLETAPRAASPPGPVRSALVTGFSSAVPVSLI